MACCRYVELNPVRAGMVIDPVEYRWSSYLSKLGVTPQEWLDYDSCFMELDAVAATRPRKYEEWVKGDTARWFKRQ